MWPSCGNCARPADGSPPKAYNRGRSATGHGTAYDPGAEPSAALRWLWLLRDACGQRRPGLCASITATHPHSPATLSAAAPRSAAPIRPGYYPGKLVQPRRSRSRASACAACSACRTIRRPLVQRAQVVRPRRIRPAGGGRRPAGEAEGRSHAPMSSCSAMPWRSFAGQGLDAHFAENQDVDVVRKVRGDVGLVRSRSRPTGRRPSRTTLDGGQKITVAVVMLGTQRPPADQGGRRTDEPLSDRWKDALSRSGSMRSRTSSTSAASSAGLDRPAADEERQDLRRLSRHERDLRGKRAAQRRHLCGYLAGLRRRRQPLHA